MVKISDLAARILGRKLGQVNAGEVEAEIVPEAGTRVSGRLTSAWDLPDNLEVLPEYEFIKEAILGGEPQPIFVTGEASTGKSTLIHWLVKNLDNCALVAPTAIAASNIHGSTIHSFFGLPPTHIDPEEEHQVSATTRVVMENMSCLVIDEISMVSPNILDAMDGILRRVKASDQPFGGLHVVMVGDLFQLPPVVASEEEKVYFTHRYKSPFFFSADVFKDERAQLIPLTLARVRRQNSSKLIEALSAIRVGENYRESLGFFNRSCFRDVDSSKEADLCLVPRNNQARQINQNRLDSLPGDLNTFDAKTSGNIQADKWRLLVPSSLNLKLGARVIFLNNQAEWINGDLGEVVGYGEEAIRIRKLATDNVVSVPRHTWSKYTYVYDYKARKIAKSVVASFTQYPLNLGWAMTIHKSQGMTLENYAIDLGSGAFGEGQVYVALSRAKSLESIQLRKPISMSDVKVHPVVREFYRRIEGI